jgi:sulfatase modifying factor 1
MNLAISMFIALSVSAPPDFVQIPAGTYSLGCPACNASENAPKVVEVAAFEMARTETTVAQYRECVDASVCVAPTESTNWAANDSDAFPINGVAWSDAAAYCGWAGGRMCTADEWEAAVRGTAGRAFPWGNDPASCSLTSCGSVAENVGRPAGANPQGVENLIDGVAEWTASCFTLQLFGSPVFCSYARVVGSSNGASLALADAGRRGAVPPYFRGDSVGFRCCR